MNPNERTISFLQDMLDHARHVEKFVKDVGQDAFETDLTIQFATLRALEVIGEAAKSIPEDIRLSAPDIPWRQMTRMRDKLIHHYFGVDAAVVWATATTDMQPLIEALTGLIEKVTKKDF